MDKKIEIINLELGLDLSSAIRAKASEVSKDIKIYTDGLVKQGTLKRQQVNKKQLVQNQWDERIERVVKLLIDARLTEDPWVNWEILLRAANTENLALSPLMQRVKTYLKRDDLWALIKMKRRGETVYSLQKFGKLG